MAGAQDPDGLLAAATAEPMELTGEELDQVVGGLAREWRHEPDRIADTTTDGSGRPDLLSGAYAIA
jgi:hypothetical protein